MLNRQMALAVITDGLTLSLSTEDTDKKGFQKFGNVSENLGRFLVRSVHLRGMILN